MIPRIYFALVLAMVSVGCSTLGIKEPTATFNAMNVANVTPQGFTMNFDMSLNNPNSMELPLSNADYKLGVGGVNILEGKAKPTGSLPANGSLPLTLPVTVTFENLLAAEKALAKGGAEIPYSFDGGLEVGGGQMLLGQSKRIPLKYSGTLNLRDILKDPQVLMQSEAAKKLAQRVLGGFLSR